MAEFKELLVLIYLNDYEDEYTLFELKHLCNFSTNQLKTFLNKMEENELITTINNKLEITDNGKNFLREKGLIEKSINELFEEKVSLNFIDSPLNIGDIYIPKNFKK